MPGRRPARWWALCVLHNCAVHPLLPLAEVLGAVGWNRAAAAIYWAHDRSYPEE